MPSGPPLPVSRGQPAVIPRADVDPATLEVLADLLVDFAPADDPDHPVVNDGTLPFGPAVAVPDGAPLLDRVIGLAGRDPARAPGAAPAR